MRRLAIAALGLALVLALALGLGAFELARSAGAFETIQPHFDGTCAEVRGLRGPEDLTIHPRTGVAYVSAADRRAALAGEPVPGSIWAYDLTAETPELRNLTPAFDPRFLPHGISLYAAADPAGAGDRLFVVDHRLRDDGSLDQRVLVFDVERAELVHRRTLRDPLLVSPNDVVAVGPDRFYVTNDHGASRGVARLLEDFLRLGGGGVVYFDGEGFREVWSGIPYANGINVSRDGATLWVTSSNTGALYVFDRDGESGGLSLRETLDLGTGGDNIELGPDGSLWIGAHPKLLDFVAHARDPGHPSPSQVLRVSPDGRIEEVYLDSGDALSGSSVAAVRGDRLLIGAVFEDHFLDCRRGAWAGSPF